MLINLRNALMTGGSEPAPAYWGLCFTAETAGATIALTRGKSAPAVSVETSFDGTTWTPYTIGTTITLAAIGDTVYFAAGAGGNTQFADSRAATRAHKFTMTGRIAAGGSIMSLLDRNNKNLRAFSADYVFCNFFDGCASLTAAPELPATQLTSTCYRLMFRGCTSLTAAPELPATTLSDACYSNMFVNCTSLTAARLNSLLQRLFQLATGVYLAIVQTSEESRSISVTGGLHLDKRQRTGCAAWLLLAYSDAPQRFRIQAQISASPKYQRAGLWRHSKGAQS